MSEEKKEYDNEMRGSLWLDTERTNEKAPTATGTVTISGLVLRIAMWPKRVAKVKGQDRTYWPVAVEYKQGTKFVLAKVNPAHVVVTGAQAVASASTPDDGPSDQPDSAPDDMPFLR